MANYIRQYDVADYYAPNVLGAVVYEFHQGALTDGEKGFGDIMQEKIKILLIECCIF